MKKKILEKRLEDNEIVIEIISFSIFNSIPSFLLCLLSIFLTFLMMSNIPTVIENKKEFLLFYNYGIDIMKAISLTLFIILSYSILKNLFGFVAFTNKRIILFKGFFFTTFSELNWEAYSGNDMKRSLLGRVLFYAKFSIYGYGMQIINIPLNHSYKRILKHLHITKNI